MRNIKDVMGTGKVIALTVMDVCLESERRTRNNISQYDAYIGNMLLEIGKNC